MQMSSCLPWFSRENGKASSSSSLILALGLNPSFQKTLMFEELKPGNVNRAGSIRVGMGGKGQHFVRAANTLRKGSTLIAHFVGGSQGAFIREAIDLFSPNAQPHIHVEIKNATRTCTTLLCRKTGHMTELIEPSPTITPEDMQKLSHEVYSLLKTNKIRAMAFCGTTPPGVPPEFLADLARNRDPQTLLLLDGYQNVHSILETNTVDILKINAVELASLVPDEPGLCERAMLVISRYQVKHVAITDGANKAFLFSQDGSAFQFTIPRIEVFNTIGAGDTCGAVMLVSMVFNKFPVVDAFRLGLAAACASCLHPDGAEFSTDEMLSLAPRVECAPMPKL